MSLLKRAHGLGQRDKTESNNARQKHFCTAFATVHACEALQQMRQKVRQTAYRGERGCKIASPLSSKASATARTGGRGPIARGRRRQPRRDGLARHRPPRPIGAGDGNRSGEEPVATSPLLLFLQIRAAEASTREKGRGGGVDGDGRAPTEDGHGARPLGKEGAPLRRRKVAAHGRRGRRKLRRMRRRGRVDGTGAASRVAIHGAAAVPSLSAGGFVAGEHEQDAIALCLSYVGAGGLRRRGKTLWW
jgi:hypothetical protein